MSQEIYDLRMEMARLSGIEPRLEYLMENADPKAIAVAQEYVRLSRLQDYESDYDGLRWGSGSHQKVATEVVDLILKDVFQGLKDHLRGHMLGTAAKACRQTMTPWWEEFVQDKISEARIRAEQAEEERDYAIHCREEAEIKIDKIRALHSETRVHVVYDGVDTTSTPVCKHCFHPTPCPTLREIDNG